MIRRISWALASLVTVSLGDIAIGPLEASPLVMPAPIVPVEVVELPRAPSARERECMARVIYHEARGETFRGKIAVGMTVINRMNDERFPDDICSVVYQKSGGRCQYTWACDRNLKRVRVEPKQWADSAHVADLVLSDSVVDPTRGATHFHNKTIKTPYRKYYKQASVIDNHVFYRR